MYKGGRDFEIGTASNYSGGRGILNSVQHLSMQERGRGFNESYFMTLFCRCFHYAAT